MAKPSVAVLFWGRRGGGSVLAEQLATSAAVLGLDVHVFLRPSNANSKFGVLKFGVWIKELKRFLESIISNRITKVIFVMASPWDVFLDSILRSKGVKGVRIIHEASPHKGEYFPPRFWVRILIRNTDLVVALTNFVKKELVQNFGIDEGKVSVCSLPPAPILIDFKSNNNPKITRLLFIGRGKSYKGQKMLEESLRFLEHENIVVSIVGKWHNKPKSGSKFFHLDAWVNDLELQTWIAKSDIVLFPYLEASQSGLIPISTLLGKPVVITPVGGLREQVIPGVNAIVAENLSPQAFANAIRNAILTDWEVPKISEKEMSKKLLLTCLELENFQ
jgi:glycosyltransferase involved in cell wall biosynthesis